jgi:hypothetical protein
MITEVSRAIETSGLKRIGIIGTRTVMETRFYGRIASAQIVPPSEPDLDDLYAFGAHVPYASCACLYGLAAVLSSNIVTRRRTVSKGPVTTKSIFSGIHYIREKRNILGAISLDLFVVLLGGATALLPAYARDILHTGPWGLGLLRLAPALGALSTSIFLAHHPIRKHAGRRMFVAVVVFGVATIAFALSRMCCYRWEFFAYWELRT